MGQAAELLRTEDWLYMLANRTVGEEVGKELDGMLLLGRADGLLLLL